MTSFTLRSKEFRKASIWHGRLIRTEENNKITLNHYFLNDPNCCDVSFVALLHLVRAPTSILPFDMEAAEQMIASRHKKTPSPTTNVLRVELGRAQSLEMVLADTGQILASK